MSNVVNLPNQYETDLKAMFGPEIPRMCKVVVEGRCIPGLYAQDKGQIVEFCFSHNFCVVYEVARDAALQFASAIANALAIGQGYTHLGATTKDAPFAPQGMQLNENQEKPH